MHPDLVTLIALQLRDAERQRLNAELAEAPRKVAAAEKTLAARRHAATTLTSALDTEAALRRRQDSDIADRRTRIARLRAQLASATSAAQITAWEHEIGFLQTAVTTLEDEEYASLERTEASEAALTTAREAVTAAESFVADAQAQRDEVTARHAAALPVLDRERAQLRAHTGEAALALYDRVSKARGSGVAEALDGQCSACHVRVRAQRWNDLTDRSREDELFPCESCGRLLYWDPRRDAPVRWQPGQMPDFAEAGA